MKKTILATLAALIVGSMVPAPVEAASDSVRVRVLHASPDAPAVDIVIDGATVLEDVSFGQLSDYLSVKPGRYHVQVKPANASSPIVIDQMVSLRGHRDYTIAAIDNLSEIRPLVTKDRTWNVSGRGRVRVVHASPDAPAVDIAVKNGPVVFQHVAFGESTKYLKLNQGTYDLEVRLAGTTQVVASLPNTTIENGKLYTVYALGLVNGKPSFELKTVADSPSPYKE